MKKKDAKVGRIDMQWIGDKGEFSYRPNDREFSILQPQIPEGEIRRSTLVAAVTPNTRITVKNGRRVKIWSLQKLNGQQVTVIARVRTLHHRVDDIPLQAHTCLHLIIVPS